MAEQIVLAVVNYTIPGSPDSDEVAYFSDNKFITASGDTPSNHSFEARLKSGIEYSVNVSTWFWATNTDFGVGQIDIINEDGELDDWAGYLFRDRVVDIYIAEVDNTFASATKVASCIIDRVEFPDEGAARIVIANKVALLEIPISQNVFDSSTGSLEGDPTPMCWGECNLAPTYLVDSATLDYFAHDGGYAEITATYDRGVEPASWTPIANGVTLGVNPDGKITVDIRGFQITSGHTLSDLAGSGTGTSDNVLVNSDFTAFTSGDPDNWNIVNESSPTRFIDRYSLTNSLEVYNDQSNTVAVRLVSETELIIGRWYGVRIETLNQSGTTDNWTYVVQTSENNDGTGSGQAISAVQTDASPGVDTFYFQAEQPFLTISVYGNVFTGTDSHIRLNYIRVYPVTTAMEYIDEIVPDMIVREGTLGSGDINSSDLSYLATTSGIGYRLNYNVSDTSTIKEAIDQVMDTHGGWWFVDAIGDFRFGRLEVPTGSPDYSFTEDDLIGDLEILDDTAPGLSTKIAANRNWDPYDSDVIAGKVLDDSGDPNDFTVDHRIKLESAVSVDPKYNHANKACAFPTLLKDEPDAQNEVDRWGTLFSAPRKFYTFTTFIEGLGVLAVTPGDVVQLTHSRYGLDSGKLLRVIGVNGEFGNGVLQIRCWG